MTYDFDSIVWIQTSFLGDVVLNTAAFALAKTKFPEAKQFVVTTPIAAKAIDGQPYLDTVLAWAKHREGFLAIRRRLHSLLRSQNCRRPLVLRAHRSFRSALLAKLLRVPSIGYRQSSLAFLNTINVDRIACFHEAIRLSLLLEPLGVSREEILAARPLMYSLPLLGPESEAMQLFTTWRSQQQRRRLVGIAAGSVWATKRWPIESFTNLARAILDFYDDVGLVLLGAANEAELAKTIQKGLEDRQDCVINLVGRTSLEDLTRLYPSLDLLVSNDSSPIHYGSSFQVPTVAVFGATITAMGFGPLAQRSRVVERSLKELACRPCGDHGPRQCPLGHFNCMRSIDVATVLGQVKAVLA